MPATAATVGATVSFQGSSYYVYANGTPSQPWAYCVTSSGGTCASGAESYSAGNIGTCEVLHPESPYSYLDGYVTAQVTAKGINSSGRLQNYFDVAYTATTKADSGSRYLSCKYADGSANGTNLVLANAVTVYGGSPVIYSTTQYAPTTPGGPFYATLWGERFGPSPGTVTACTHESGLFPPLCTSTPDLQVTVSGAQFTYWSDNQINVLITPSATASGTYDLAVNSAGPDGQGFAYNPSDPLQGQSNRKSITVAPSPTVTSAMITVANSIPGGSTSSNPSSSSAIPAGPLQWPSSLWATPIVLLRDLPSVAVSATVTPPGSGATVSFQVVRNPSDASSIGSQTDLPTIAPGGAVCANLGPNCATLTLNQTGSFQILAYIDSNNNKQWDPGEAGVALPLVLVKATLGANQSAPHSGNIAYTSNTPWTYSAIHSGLFQLAAPEYSAAYLNQEIDLVGGGSDGSIGVNPFAGASVNSGWVQRATVSPNIAATYQSGHDVFHVWASNGSTDASGSSSAFGESPSEPMFLKGDNAPVPVPAPLLDTGRASPGTGGDSSSLNFSQPLSNLKNTDALGYILIMHAVDSPGLPFPAAQPSFPGSAMQSLQMNYSFTASLVLWTDTFDHLYGVILEQPWAIAASFTVDASGNGTSTAKSVTLDPTQAIKHVPIVPVSATGTLMVGQTVLRVGAYDARN